METFTLYENGSVISNETDPGVWIKTLYSGGEVTYKCQANNYVGTSSKALFSEGEATEFLNCFKNLPTIYCNVHFNTD